MTIYINQYNNILSFTLNGNKLSRPDMVLLLKMLGFDVPSDCPRFAKACCDSLSQVDREEIQMVLADFIALHPADREIWEGIIQTKWLFETYSNPN